MEILFLGTSCMVPTKERNHPSLLISYKSQGILVDCGEGTQRQLKIANIKPTKITKILISHWHGDHVLGLPGLFQTLSNSGYDSVLEIYGPKKTKKRIESLFSAFEFENKIDFRITEIKKKKIFENDQFMLEAQKLRHGIDCYGFNFIEKDRRRIKVKKILKAGLSEGPLVGELQKGKDIIFKGKKIYAEEFTYTVKGKKISIINDTEICSECYNLSENADLLICEAVYTSDNEDKAREYKHITAKQAAHLASKNNIKKLVLTHISQRYKTSAPILKEAKEIFPECECAYDFMKIKM